MNTAQQQRSQDIIKYSKMQTVNVGLILHFEEFDRSHI